ncbi:serine hydrolase domain-containing protein [Chitinophaga pinensis]|uniref:Beta-lactamase family protein n=1 Tax=Chitinophaga pinensis TaxID=79329 RepID=A0A5C6LTR3_9BACT|nr:serine hydrolase domain-containing protein [Chitinophaga pinensis]TWV98845.1 beta-lactamase family protein [Chitinophaga pinensis]
MKWLLFSASLIFTLCTRESGPVSVGEQYNFTKVDTYVDAHLKEYSNSVAILVSKDNAVIYKKEVNLDITQQRIIASASKWLSAAVIMSLADEKKLSLNDTVGKFLPLFTAHGKGNITIRQLFSHTSGFPGDSPQRYEYNKDLTLAAAVDSMACYTDMIHKPGTAFNYGGVSMHIAGRIAEVVSGKRWQTLFNERIADPCEMEANYILVRPANPLIAGGVRTSARDYLNFLEMLLNKGMFHQHRVLSETAVSELLRDQTAGAVIENTPYPLNPYTPYKTGEVRYGMGNWRDVVNADGVAEENSSPGAFGAHPWIDVKHHVAGIIFTRTTPKISNTSSLKIREMIRHILDGKPV